MSIQQKFTSGDFFILQIGINVFLFFENVIITTWQHQGQQRRQKFNASFFSLFFIITDNLSEIKKNCRYGFWVNSIEDIISSEKISKSVTLLFQPSTEKALQWSPIRAH